MKAAALKIACPSCQRKLKLFKSSGFVKCPGCACRFDINGASAHGSASTAVTVQTPPPWLATGPAPPASDSTLELTPSAGDVALDEPTSTGRLLLVATGGAAFLGIGIWLLILGLGSGSTPAEPTIPDVVVDAPFVPKPSPPKPAPSASVPKVVLALAKGDILPPPPMVEKIQPLEATAKPKSMAAAGAHPGVDQEKVNQTIERGAAFLAANVNLDQRMGAKALLGLTLLHCGRPVTDPAVVSCAQQVRQQARSNLLNYHVACAIMFLDRLGEPSDKALIQSLAMRLIASQGKQGGWSYACLQLNDKQEAELRAILESRQSITSSSPAPSEAPKKKSKTGGALPSPLNLNALPVLQFQPGSKLQNLGPAQADNSNTQFAVLALWCSQKHGVPVERSLAFVEARFRESQANNGSWTYVWNQGGGIGWADSMTCAGLLGLAVGRGADDAGRANLKGGDPAIDKALTFVASRVGKPGPKVGAGGPIVGANAHGDLYYLWTLERAMVIYDLQTVGGIDWYAWGAPLIVAAQGADGSWRERHPVVPDTCFALLFLKRANVAQDLTVRLQDLAISKSVGERTSSVARTAGDDPYERRPSLDRSQRELAGYVRGRADER